jgi:Ca-activated chloride channel homolog
MSLASWWALLFFIPLVGVMGYAVLRKNPEHGSLQFSYLGDYVRRFKTLRTRLVPLPKYLKYIAVTLAIIALARPQRADDKLNRNVEGIDIMIALDVSDSMLIEDMLPDNRMESSKRVIRDFIKQRISDRIGLVIFSGEAYTRVPLTLDYPVLLDNLSKVATTRNIKMGTAIGVALASAVGRLKDSTAKTRVVILATDGENNSGTVDPITALHIAKGYGIRVYTIGMGKDGDAQLPIISKGPGGIDIKRYQPIHSKINDELLTQLAEETGGKYYRAITTDALAGVFKEIDRLEKTKVEVTHYTRYAELFPWYLRWALILYLLAAFLAATWLRRAV